MKSTREKILRTLLSSPESTINELAEAVGINGISIRHHLTSLEADDLVVSSEERHGVGRPRLIYSLTDKGVEKFPTGYLRLTRRLIGALKENMSSTEMAALFGSIGSEIAEKYINELDGKSIKERLKTLEKLMTQEGFVFEYKKNKNYYLLSSLTCPYHQIINEYPELCNIDYQLISSFLSTKIEIKSCILNGDECCSYRVPLEKSEG
jgi:predicted ArsR family transcriptional regulator